MEAKEFITRFNALVKETNESILWRKMHETVTLEAAQTWVLQWGRFTRHSRQCWANVVGNCPHIDVRRFIVTENLWDEEANEATSHFELLIKMGEAVGLTGDQIRNAAPTDATTVALLAWETLTRSRPWIEGLAAKACLEQTNVPEVGDWSAVEARRWIDHLGLDASNVEFFTLHAELDKEHGGGSLEMITKYATPLDLDRALAATEASLAAWRVYFDGIATAVPTLAGQL